MSRIINTSKLEEELQTLTSDGFQWAYNGLDVLLPHEILEQVKDRMTPGQKMVYDFSRNLQGPALDMMLNGVLVDQNKLAEMLSKAKAEKDLLEDYVQCLAQVTWEQGLNVRSPEQLKQLFYYDPQGYSLKPKYKAAAGQKSVTTERTALEAIAAENYYTRPMVNAILALKDTGKSIEFLQRGIEDDGRVRCSFNIAGTESGRWSSSQNPWGRGANFQNQPEAVRCIYVADQNEIFAYPDLSQAESRGVAYLSRDPDYIRAVESGDIHTAVARMVWPALAWTGELAEDKKVAEQKFYRDFSYRDIAKRGGHGTNYYGKPWTMARHLHVEQSIVEEFQTDYFNAFPGIRAWHREVQRELQDAGKLKTPLGRERTFFGRLTSDDTLKEAIAWYPQSLISDILKIGALRLWRSLPKVRLLADMHDGLLISIEELYLDDMAPAIINLMTIPVKMGDFVMTIPVDLTVGYRWTKEEMVKWKPGVLTHLEKPNVAEDLLDLDASGV